ncbi:T9SS type A sorting domain-containing protein [candidate division KSB1 bacterium]
MRKIYFVAILMIALIGQLNAQTWTTVTTPSTAGVNHMLVANNKLFIATLYGMFSSTDGITWDSASTGMTPVLPSLGYYYVGNIYNYNNVLYSAIGGSKLYKSVDYGANWTEIPGVKEQFTSPSFTAVYVKGDTMIVGLDKSLGIRKSYDGGTTWTSTGSAASFHEVVDRNIIELNGAIYVKTQKGVFKSTDMATSFTQLTGGLPTYSGSVGALTVSNGVLICTIYLVGTYISSDYGVTWTQTSTTIANGRGFHVEGGNVYLACAGAKIYSSSNNGTTWTDISGTGIVGIGQMTNFAIFNGYLYVGSGDGLFKTPIGTPVNENVQAENSLSVYPNPVSNLLTISSTEKFNNCMIKMYGIRGELLIENRVDADNKHHIDMTNYSNGIYFIEVYHDKSVSRHKVIKN